MQFVAKNLAQTDKLAKEFAKKLKRGDVVTFTGDLGAGKTTFIKSLCAYLGVKDAVVSPSFTIVNEYNGNEHIYHLDLYRLESFDEALNTGCVDIINNLDGICFIEWPQVIQSILPQDCIKVDIKIVNNDRVFTVEGI